MDLFKLNSENPSPFKQPFLVLYFGNGNWWTIDVDGEIDKYLNRYSDVKKILLALSDEEKKRLGVPWEICKVLGEASDWRSQATPLLNEMLRQIREHTGLAPLRIYAYEGSAGPNHILRQGALFKRQGAEEIHLDESRQPTSKDIDVGRFVHAILAASV
jgi:hypothetical protein